MKKRVWKRILVVLLVLVVIVGAAGLVLVKSAADMVPRMQERLEQATSIHYMYYMDIDASSLATTSSARISGDISMVMSDPVAMEMDLTMSGSGPEEANLYHIYAVPEGDSEKVYVGMADKEDMKWYRATLSAELFRANVQSLDIREITQLSTQSDTDFRVVGMNWVQGQLALCVEGTLPPHIAQGILKNSTTGLWDRLKSLFGTPDTPEETAAEVPVRVWIGLFSRLPVKYEIDATQLMQQIVQKNQEDGTISRYAIGLEVVGYNDIQEITVPQEVQDASKNLTFWKD
jgi:hypothetical protein